MNGHNLATFRASYTVKIKSQTFFWHCLPVLNTLFWTQISLPCYQCQNWSSMQFVINLNVTILSETVHHSTKKKSKEMETRYHDESLSTSKQEYFFEYEVSFYRSSYRWCNVSAVILLRDLFQFWLQLQIQLQFWCHPRVKQIGGRPDGITWKVVNRGSVCSSC